MQKPPRDVVKATQNRFRETHAKAFENWAEYRRHKRVVEEEVNARVFGREPFSDAVRASLEELRKSAFRAPVIRDGQFSGPPVFHVGPGLNISARLTTSGWRSRSGRTHLGTDVRSSGVFGVVATASSGRNTYGSAGLALFIVPSDPATNTVDPPVLSIRLLLELRIARATDGALIRPGKRRSVGAHRERARAISRGRVRRLWSGSSDYWDDGSGAESDVFRIPDSELIVSGSEYYTRQLRVPGERRLEQERVRVVRVVHPAALPRAVHRR